MSLGGDDTYNVVMTVDDSDAARKVAVQQQAVKWLDAQWRSMNDAQMRASKAAADGTSAAVAPTAQLGAAFREATSQIGRMAVQFAVLQGGQKMFESFRDSLTHMREFAKQTSDEMFHIRDSMRDIMSIRGMVSGPGAETVIKELLAGVKATGMTQTEYHDFTEQFLGGAEAFRGKMKPADFEELQQAAAKFAVVQGGDPAMHARIAGLILQQGRQGMTAGESEAQQAEYYRLLNLGTGRTPLLGQSFAEAGARLVAPEGKPGGLVGNLRDLAVLTSGASRLSGEGAVDTKLEQFARGVTGTTGRGGAEWTKYLRDTLHIAAGTTAEDAMGRVFDAMDEATKSGQELNTWLQSKGMRDRNISSTMIGMLGQRREMEAEFRKPSEYTPEKARAEIAAAYAPPERGGRQDIDTRMANAALFVARAERSMQSERSEALKTRGMARGIAERAVGVDYEVQRGPAEMLRDFYTEHVFGIAHDEIVAQQYAASEFEKNRGLRFQKSAPQRSALSGLTVGAALNPLAGAMSYLGSGGTAYAASNQFETDVGTSLGTPERLYMGPDAQMHTIGEMHAMNRARGVSEQEWNRIANALLSKPAVAPAPGQRQPK